MPRRSSTAQDLAQIAVFAALIAALGLPGQLLLGSSAVPLTFQTLGVMLAGAMLGPRKGPLAVLVFLALCFAGLPLLAGGRTGLTAITSASGGYLVGFVVGAFVIGLLTQRLLPRYPLWAGIGANVLGGMVAIYAIGVPWTAIRVDLPLWTAVVDSVKFWPGDLVKAVVTAVVARQVHRALPGLLPARRRNAADAPRPSRSRTP
jgi:biotin transport system substrate-specific component